jgi:hypothetical protein
MSNRIDFFQSAQTQLALPGASVSVLVGGRLCPFVEPIEIVCGVWPEFSWARIAYNPAAYAGTDLIAAEDIEAELAMGERVCIRQVYNRIPPGAAAFALPLFEGQIEGIKTEIGDKGERVEIIVRDFSASLERVTVYGQRLGNTDGSCLFLGSVDTIFNPDGKANANPETVMIDGKSYTVFCAEQSQSRTWNYAEVINYLLCEYLVDGQLQAPTVEQLQVLTENQIVRDLDVTGLSLLEALHRCCERIGLQFKFVPRLVPVGPGQAIVFYKKGTGRIVELNCQRSGEQFSISKTNIAALSSRKNLWPVIRKYIGQGDFKVYEATFELVKAWDPADEETGYDEYSPSTNGDFHQVRNVYRKWCLNEAGDYSDAPYNQGDAFDFSKIFESGNFACRRRRFWPALTTDKQGRSLGYYLQVSFDNGLHWWQYLYAFNNLLNECGVWLSSDRLDANTWIAALKDVLKFRITASIVSDERLSCVVADGPVNSTAPVIEHVITLPRQFKYRKVSGRSIFANLNDSALSTPDEVDDSASLHEFVRKKALAGSSVIEATDVQTPYLVFDYRVGDRVTSSPESRDLLSCRSDNRSTSWIKRVQMDFTKQCTNINIVRERIPQL